MSSRLARCGLLLFFAAAFAPSAVAADKEAIDRAVARGVAYLKETQGADGSWAHQYPGATALAGLALLECGVPASDPAVKRAAILLRQASIPLTHTYSLALCNMFFDRLGDPGDVALIDSITVRLLAGQSSQGGWTYQCPGIGEAEARRLATHVTQQAELVGKRELPKHLPKRTPNDLPPQIREQLGWLVNRTRENIPPTPNQAAVLGRDDNSNTQFAILGLWVSRKHGLPVDAALARAERHFRRTQNADAGWGYIGTGSTPAMTCAGLLGLAMGYGATGEAVLRTDVSKPAGTGPAQGGGRNLGADRVVGAALALVSTAIGVPRGKRLPGGVGNFDPTPRTAPDYYYLWSLERVAVVYDLKTIGRKDWYTWGAEVLVEHQEPGGGWSGKYGLPDTCFALLFLGRSNVASDLTAALRGRLRDGEVRLRAGGFKDVGKPAPSESSDKATPVATGPTPSPYRPEPKSATAPPAAARPLEVQRLTDALVQAPAGRQQVVLTELVEGKGSVHTEALAAAIPRLTGEAKQQARDGLAKRLARMTAATLRDKFKEDDSEIRRAAALAVELKGERQLIPDLIGLLEDADRSVARAAHVALKEMAGRDFGPAAQATPAERDQAVARWKAWWAKQKPK